MISYRLEIFTPHGRVLSEKVLHASVPAEDGFVGVLANHATYVTSSPGGNFEFRLPSGVTQKLVVGPGFFRVAKNEAFFLAQSVKTPAL